MGLKKQTKKQLKKPMQKTIIRIKKTIGGEKKPITYPCIPLQKNKVIGNENIYSHQSPLFFIKDIPPLFQKVPPFNASRLSF